MKRYLIDEYDDVRSILLEWPDNLNISDMPPREYVPQLRSRFSKGEWAAMQEFYALPEGWEQMEYSEFLARRRGLMAGIIRRGFDTLR